MYLLPPGHQCEFAEDGTNGGGGSDASVFGLPWAVALYMWVQACVSGAIQGVKSRSCTTISLSSRLLILVSPHVLLNDTRRCWVVVEKEELNMKYLLVGSHKTPPMPAP